MERKERLNQILEELAGFDDLLPRRVIRVLSTIGFEDKKIKQNGLPKSVHNFIHTNWDKIVDKDVLKIADQSGIDTSNSEDVTNWFRTTLIAMFGYIRKNKSRNSMYEFVRRCENRNADFVAKKALEALGIMKRTRARKFPEDIVAMEKELAQWQSKEVITKQDEKDRFAYAIRSQMQGKHEVQIMPPEEKWAYMAETARLVNERVERRRKISELRHKIDMAKAAFRLREGYYEYDKEQ